MNRLEEVLKGQTVVEVQARDGVRDEYTSILLILSNGVVIELEAMHDHDVAYILCEVRR